MVEYFDYGVFGYKSDYRDDVVIGKIFKIDFFREESSKVKYILTENNYLTFKSEIIDEIVITIEYFKRDLESILLYSEALQRDYLKVKNVLDLNITNLEEMNVDIKIEIDIKELEYNYIKFTKMITKISYFSILKILDFEFYNRVKKDIDFLISVFKTYRKSHFENIEVENEFFINLEAYGSESMNDSLFNTVAKNFNLFLEDEDEHL